MALVDKYNSSHFFFVQMLDALILVLIKIVRTLLKLVSIHKCSCILTVRAKGRFVTMIKTKHRP